MAIFSSLSVYCSKFLSTSAKTMSNLSKHLSAQHGNTKLVAKDPARRSHEGVTQQPTTPKQAELFSTSLGAQRLTQKDMNKLVAGFIVEDKLPLLSIELPSFRKVLDKIPTTHKPTSDRKTFSQYLDKCYSDMESNLKELLSLWIMCLPPRTFDPSALL